MSGVGITYINPKVFAVEQVNSAFWENYWETRYPSLLTAIMVTETRIDLSWTNNGIVDYDGVVIERSSDAINYNEIGTVEAGETSYKDETCIKTVLYYYRLRYFKN